MNNEELIKNYEDVSVEYIKLLKEVITRQLNKELTPVEWEKVREISSKTGAYIFDTFAMGVDRKTLKEAVYSSIETLANENR